MSTRSIFLLILSSILSQLSFGEEVLHLKLKPENMALINLSNQDQMIEWLN